MRKNLLIASLLFPLPLLASNFSFEVPQNNVHLSYRAVAIHNTTSGAQQIKTLTLSKLPEGVELCAANSNCSPVYQSTCNQNAVLASQASCLLWFHAQRQEKFSASTEQTITVIVENEHQQQSQQKIQLSTKQQLFVGGDFSVPGENIAMWDGQQWSSVGEGLLGGAVLNLVAYQGDVVAAGEFYQAGTTFVNFIARWDGERWNPLGDGVGDPGPSALTVYADSLFVGGGFGEVGGVDAQYLGSFFDERWSGFQTGLDMPITMLKGDNHHLYVGGHFTDPVDHVAIWEHDHWVSMGAGLDGSVLALATDAKGMLYAGGMFSHSSDIALNHIAQWNGKIWQPLASGLSNTVYTLATQGSFLYAGGNFAKADSKTVNYIARWDGKEWQSLAGGLTKEKTPQFTQVYGIDGFSDDVFAVGYFTTAHNSNADVTVNNIARWQPSSHKWFNLGEGLNGIAHSVLTIAVLELSLIK